MQDTKDLAQFGGRLSLGVDVEVDERLKAGKIKL
jgi:hypothetical protein